MIPSTVRDQPTPCVLLCALINQMLMYVVRKERNVRAEKNDLKAAKYRITRSPDTESLLKYGTVALLRPPALCEIRNCVYVYAE